MTDSGNVDTLKIEEPHDDAASLAERQRRFEQEQDRAFEERLALAEERKAEQEQDDKAFAERLALAEERKAEQEQHDKAFAERLALAEERKAEQEQHDKAFAERLALAEERKAEQEQHNKACAERLALAEERKAKQEQHDVEEEQNDRVLAPHIAGLRRGEASKKIDLKGLHEDRCRRNPSLVKKDPSPFQKVGAGLKKFCEDHGDKIATVVVGVVGVGLGLALGGSSGNTDISDNSCTRFINRHWATDTQRVYDSGEVVKNAAGRWIEKATGRFVKPMV